MKRDIDPLTAEQAKAFQEEELARTRRVMGKCLLAVAILAAIVAIFGCQGGGRGAGSDYPYIGPLTNNLGQKVEAPTYVSPTTTTTPR